MAINKNISAGDIYFKLDIVSLDSKKERVKLKAVIGAGDEGKAIITIMLPHKN
jgi:hypothetical protein